MKKTLQNQPMILNLVKLIFITLTVNSIVDKPLNPVK